MNCDKELLLEHLEMGSGLSLVMKKHVNECSSCNVFYKRAQKVYELIEEDKQVQLQSGFTQKVLDQLKHAEVSKSVKRILRPPQVAAIFAIGLLVGGSAAFLLPLNTSEVPVLFSDSYYLHEMPLEDIEYQLLNK
jgi:hypothetical protein